MSYFAQLARVYPDIKAVNAKFKQQPEDFVVEEVLAFDFDQIKNHFFLLIEKRGQNTRWVLEKLARTLAIDSEEIGYGGLKDRQAVTRQWFSVPASVDELNLMRVNDIDGVQFLDMQWHSKKLKASMILANDFVITLRDLNEKRAIETGLEQIKVGGFANYYGPQRFGHNENNIEKAKLCLRNAVSTNASQKDFFMLSVARAYLFNLIVSERIKGGYWDRLLSGDLLLDPCNERYSKIEATNSSKSEKLASRLTAPLFGQQGLLSSDDCESLEQHVLTHVDPIFMNLEHTPIKSDRRLIRQIPQDLSFIWLGENVLQIKMRLPRGVYATSMLRELIVDLDYDD